MSDPRRARASAAALLIGLVALVAPPSGSRSEPVTWQSLLAPYGLGTPLPNGFRVASVRRGIASDIVLDIRDSAGEPAAEVHVLQRGRWSGVRESRSFSIGYETPRSPSPEREAITELLAETIRRRDHGLPSPDLIPLGAALDPGVLPWWLDMLRGWRGVLVGANLAMLALLVVVGSPSMAMTAVALAGVDIVARFAGVPYGYPDLGGAWVLPVAFFLLALALRGRSTIARGDVVAAILVGGFALSLRLFLGTWGPHHPNGYAPLFVIGAARDHAAVATYGPGYAEVFAPVAALAPSSPDWAIFACNVLVSGLAVALAFTMARVIGLPRAAAAAGALLLAVDPVAIRTAATESYFPVILFLASVAAIALLLGTRRLAAGARWRAAAFLAAAGLLLAQAARIQPSAWVAAAAAPSAVLALDAVATSRRATALFAGAAMVGGIVVATSGSVLLDVLSHIRGGTLFRPSTPSLAPLVWVSLAAAAHAALSRRPGLSLAAAVPLATVALTRQAFWEAWIWQQSYERVHFSLPAIALAAAVPAFFYRRVPAIVLASLGAFAWFQLAWPIVAARTTDHLEYRWLRDRLLELPPVCRIIHVEAAAKRALVIPTYLRPAPGTAVGIVDGESRTLTAALAPADCLYYVRTSLCSSAEGRAACDAVERRLVLAPVARASFPAVPSRDKIPYDRDPVETSIARVERVTPSSP